MADAETVVEMPGAEPRGRGKMKFKNKLFLILFSLLLMGVLRTGFMFVIIGVMPSIVAYYMDVTSTRYTFKTIFACNMTAIMPYVGHLLQHGPSRSAALQEVMGDLHSWITIYGAALIGWMLVKVCPMFTQFMVVGMTHAQTARIENVQKKIESEWGHEVTQFSRAAKEIEAEEDAY